MKVNIIKKKFNPKANLKDYEKEYKDFDINLFKAEIKCFPDGKTNAAYLATDIHLKGPNKNKIALYWEGENGQELKYSFLELSEASSKTGNLLKNIGVEKGDRVFIFLPRIPELFISFLGILKIGAIAGTLFAAFGPQALEDRLKNSGAKVLITHPDFYSRVKKILPQLKNLEKIILIDEKNRVNFLEEKNLEKSPKIDNCQFYYSLMEKASSKLKVSHMNLTDPAFMLYTSGTTGKPKGVVHHHQAILHEKISAKYVLDIKDNDVYWCTADPGWVTGIAYEILGTWALGASTLVYQGRFNPEKWYSLIEEYKVNVWYTAPTAIRMLAASGLDLVKKFDLTSLRHLASVGEPLNPESVLWGIKAFNLPFHDNYWQTETGGIVIANYPNLDIKAGSMGKPMLGIKAAIVDKKGKKLKPNKEGALVLKPGWSSMMKKIWRRPEKYQSYFKNNWYITGDRAYKDKDNYFWFVGRADDVIKTAGERVGPFEVESALVSHPKIIEAGVIGKPDKMRGEIIKAFVTLKKGVKPTKTLVEDIKNYVKKHLAGHAYPREIEFRDKLPKTRSGKIVRRLLKAQELGLPIGDTSTLEDY
ncbi:acetate--CoA ligase [Candidatus Beckwithbacteria bacterium CG10_big_fil_rev_8_21_14_0_10_34_10]|uniref:acetate--CoA ligase n=1 Tax=Candidatus Beckwithbacteria bacterium CG10_big_fil_rev_8_21_14_0_10_34_10 TaxID=1974495 RepID=A0A2H0WAD0_9BACT|nr:MAG: acetate--CoA ligase [Candidatus Beckwithbacteria bacterium CG10_big_fil_rev_8_21_14_0_10_34_10]